ncbi:MAG: glycosyltransferase [Bacteroidota bacterium]
MIELILIFLTIALAAHLGVTILFSIIINQWKSLKSDLSPSVSIIIAARNEFQNLKDLVPKLLEQDYSDFEIVIGLDRCADRSLDYLNSIDNEKIKVVPIEKVPTHWNSKKFVLNESIKRSAHEWLLFTDADCIPNSTQWIRSITKEIANNTDIVIGVSPYVSDRSWRSYYIQFEAFMTFFLYTAFAMFKKPYMAVGRNLAIKKSFFMSQNGYESFKSTLGGDDDLFIQKTKHIANINLVLGKNSLIKTYPSEDWKSYFRQKTRHYSVSENYSLTSKMLLTFYHVSHNLFYLALVILIWQPYFQPIILFSLFIKLVSYRFVANKIGAGFNYILLPFVDIVYAMLTPVLGIASKLVKDIKWKN